MTLSEHSVMHAINCPRLFLSLSTLAVLGIGLISLGGPITPPPGPVAPTAKPLSDIEPRTAVNATNTPGDATSLYKIVNPGSYYLTGNLTGVAGKQGITISASGVTLDLNGFDIVGPAGSSTVHDGVFSSTISGLTNIVVINGSVRGWVGSGVNLSDPNVANCRVANVLASANGGAGISIGPGSTVANCSAYNNNNGISAGAGCTITNCSVSFQSTGGIIVGTGCTVSNSSAYSNGTGISASNGCTLSNCVSTNNFFDGIVCSANGAILGNTCFGNGAIDGAGIHITGGGNRIVGNQVSFNPRGIEVAGAGNFVSGNTVSSRTTNYVCAAGNLLNLTLSQLPETISWPCTVTLAGDLTGVTGLNGIAVGADNVTIDLGGHALVGVAGSLDGISVAPNVKGLSVRNGTVRNWGASGINAANCTGGRFFDVSLLSNAQWGISMGSQAIVKDSTAVSNTGGGFLAADGNTITNSHAENNGGDGFNLHFGNRIEACGARSNSGDGVESAAGGFILNCHMDSNGAGAPVGANIRLTDGGCRVEGNSLTGGDFGIQAAVGGSVIVKNSSRGAGSNYGGIASGNDVGPIGSAATSTSPWANIQY